jgi:hypothetical protein
VGREGEAGVGENIVFRVVLAFMGERRVDEQFH